MIGEMELIPELKIGWLNGWILVCLMFLIFGILIEAFPKNVVVRLYDFDKSSCSKMQRAFTAIGKLLLGLVWLVLIIFAPLKIGSNVLIIGTILYTVSLAGFIIALFNFKNTPLDQPVVKGLYKISRHPQLFMLFILFFEICIAVGSWLLLFILIISSFLLHFRTLSEEKTCLEKYGDSYHAYMKCVPRYFLIKTNMK